MRKLRENHAMLRLLYISIPLERSGEQRLQQVRSGPPIAHFRSAEIAAVVTPGTSCSALWGLMEHPIGVFAFANVVRDETHYEFTGYYCEDD